MSEQQNFGFGKFVPGFDFLQNLTKGVPQTPALMPNLSSWVAPTLNVEELEKRISELKAVHFWLDQNSLALAATIQALELQKMTLATLRGMNFNMADVANALKLNVTDTQAGAAQGAGEKTAEPAGSVAGAAKEAVAKARADKKSGKGEQASTGVVDPLQWWGALTQQFQEIAAGAMNEAAKNTSAEAARDGVAGAATQAMKTATAMAGATAGGAARKTAASRKAGAAKKTARKSASSR